jgi:hypothetical protein
MIFVLPRAAQTPRALFHLAFFDAVLRYRAVRLHFGLLKPQVSGDGDPRGRLVTACVFHPNGPSICHTVTIAIRQGTASRH